MVTELRLDGETTPDPAEPKPTRKETALAALARLRATDPKCRRAPDSSQGFVIGGVKR